MIRGPFLSAQLDGRMDLLCERVEKMVFIIVAEHQTPPVAYRTSAVVGNVTVHEKLTNIYMLTA